MEENTKYFTVPIGMLKGLISGERDIKECASDIIDYSLYYHAVSLPFMAEGNEITTQLKAAAKFLNVRIGSIETVLRSGKTLYEKYHRKGAYCGVNTEIVWQYRDDPKTPYQIAQFCAFCATRSIIGKGEYKKTNRDLISARMFGYTNKEEMQNNTPDLTVKNISKKVRAIREKEIEERNKYQTRYHSDKILTELEFNWGLKRYADHIRGMYISYSMDLAELAKICEQSKKSVRLDTLKEAKRLARLSAKITAP